MSAILVVFNRDGQPVDRQIVDQMLDASHDRAVDGQDIWLENQIALAHQRFWIVPEEWEEIQPLGDPDSMLHITADVRLDNREELLKKLNLEKTISDALLILASYRSWGTACVAHLLGDFAFAIWDVKEEQLFIARDALGTRGLCFLLNENICLVGSEINQILAHPAVEAVINQSKIVEYLTGLSRNQEESFYSDIYYCLPAHCIVVTASSYHKWRYWDINPRNRIRYRDDKEYADHFLELLTTAVACRLRSTGLVGISMSGGLDSTSLAAISASLLSNSKLSQKALLSFSYAFNELTSCDEREYIQPMVDRWHLDASFVLCDDQWTFRDLQNWPVNKGYVMSDPYARLPLAVSEKAQQRGCRVLLAGYYGDILFLGGRNWAASMIGEFKVKEFLSTLLNPINNVNFRRDVLYNGVRHLFPHSLRNTYRRQKKLNIRSQFPGLHSSLTGDLQTRARESVIDVRKGNYTFDLWERYLNLSPNTLSQGFAATRSMYNRHGLELSLPYWDRRLVEFIMAMPADQLGRPGKNRWMLRNAMATYLPKSVLERKQRTSFRPLMEKGLLDKERAAVQKMVENPLIVEKNYVKKNWLREQFADGRSWFENRHPNFLWKCLCLELWLGKVISPQSSDSL